MKDLFMCLLLNIGKFGNVTEANMWSNISNIHIEADDCKYVVSIRKEKKDEDEKDA